MKEEFDAYVFFGYKKFGFAMKQAREMVITAPFFGSTALLDPQYYANSESAVADTECSFFTASYGNYILAQEFLISFETKFGTQPFSVWPPLQAYDALNLVLNELNTLHGAKEKNEFIDDWHRKRLLRVSY